VTQTVFACTAPGCSFVQATRGRHGRREPAVSDRATHVAEAHGGDAAYVVTERWAWLNSLIFLNALTLVASTIAAIGSALGAPLFLLGVLFPQVWGWSFAPWVGVATIAVVSIAAWIYASARPAGTSFERRFTAGVTMGAFVAALVFPIAALSLLAWVSLTYSG
jgi:hypothetical protein